VGQQARLTLVSAFEPARDLTGGLGGAIGAANSTPAPASGPPPGETNNTRTGKSPLTAMLYLPMIQR